MAKTTKQVSVEASEFGSKPVMRKAAGQKVAAKKTGSKASEAKKPASTKKGTAKKSVGGRAVVKQSSGKSTETKKTGSTKKAVAKNSVATTKVGKRSVPRGKNASGVIVPQQISCAERHRMIAEAAYLRGESQGFLSNEHEDWLLAEAEIDGLLIRADVVVID